MFKDLKEDVKFSTKEVEISPSKLFLLISFVTFVFVEFLIGCYYTFSNLGHKIGFSIVNFFQS